MEIVANIEYYFFRAVRNSLEAARLGGVEDLVKDLRQEELVFLLADDLENLLGNLVVG